MIIRRCLRQLPIFVLVLVLGLLCGGSGRADPFTVQGVHVDATGSTTISAREAARVDGQRRALDTLFERLTAAPDRVRLPKLSDAQITDLVHDFEVANERSSATRYFGDYTFRFRKNEIRKLLKAADIAFAESVSKPVVVVPVLRIGDQTVLWDGPDAAWPNPWKQAWKDVAGSRDGGTALVPLVVPAGDAADAAALNAEQALSGDPLALAAFAARYGTTEILVATAALANKDAPRADISTARYSDGQPPRRAEASYATNPGEGVPQLLARAAAASAATGEDSWKQENQLRYGQETTLTVNVPVAALADWVTLRTRLANVPPIRRSELLSLSKGQARVELHYLGDAERLRASLGQAGFTLTDGSPYPVLQSRSTGPGAAPGPAVPGTP